MSKTETNPDEPIGRRRLNWPLCRGVGARLIVLLLIAETPLAVFTIDTTLQIDRAQTRGALSGVMEAQRILLDQFNRQLVAMAAVMAATQTLPSSVLVDRPHCTGLLFALTMATGASSSVRIADASRAMQCDGAPPGTPGAAAVGVAADLSIARSVPGPAHGTTEVTLATAAPPVGAGPAPMTSVWRGRLGAWSPVRNASANALPRFPERLVLTSATPLRTVSVNGRSFLYRMIQVAPPAAAAGELLLAGTDISGIVASSSRSSTLRMSELTALFIAELILVAAGLSWVAARPLKLLNDAVDQWRDTGLFSAAHQAGAPLEVAHLFRSFGRATEALNQRQRELTEAAARQELLLQEIHHRVKNNLQIIASLLNLQASRIKAPEARGEFQTARDRVRALATLHRHLYAHGELHLVDMRAFFNELCSQLFVALDEMEGDRISLTVAAPDVNISSDQAVPIALIVTETVGNAIKFAFPDGRRGNIRVELALQQASRATLTISDDGIGLPDRTNIDRAAGLGLQLVRGFARQLGAQLSISTEHGTCYCIDMAIEQQRAPTVRLGKTAPPGMPA